jgi:hypothetical protein
MIFTSYFANIKKLPKHITPVSISRFPPQWYDGKKDLTLAPPEKILLGVKDGSITHEEYDRKYNQYLETLNPQEIAKKFDNCALLCFETPNDHCHRHLLSAWLRKNGISCEEKTGLNIAVIGSRDFDNYEYVKYRLGQLQHKFPNQTFKVVSGAARGADSLGEKWANENGLKTQIFPADWDKYGKRAGYIRNEDIIKNADIVVSFWDGQSKGTQHSMELALKQKKELLVYQTKPNHLKVETEKIFDLDNIDPNKIYVFGDNLLRKGKKGQAIIRDLPNAMGVATKRLPTMNTDAFFSDQNDEIETVKQDLREIYKQAQSGKSIVFPEDGLGTGLAKLPQKAPLTYKELDRIIDIFFGIEDISEQFLKQNTQNGKTP